jgi:hypothetical protein
MAESEIKKRVLVSYGRPGYRYQHDLRVLIFIQSKIKHKHFASIATQYSLAYKGVAS